MPHVLLIDDDTTSLKAMTVTLGEAAVSADTASTAEQALRLIQDVDHDAIISGFSMPGLAGMDFLIECKALRPDIPIIVLTRYETCELEEALKEGAYAVVQKPIKAGVLLSVVTDAVIRREVRRAAFAEGNPFSAARRLLSSRLKVIDERLKNQIAVSEKET